MNTPRSSLLILLLSFLVPLVSFSQHVVLLTQEDVNSYPITHSYDTITSLRIGDNNKESNITGLDSLHHISVIRNNLTIQNNDSLVSLDGLTDLRAVGSINILRNDKLHSLLGINNIDSVTNYIAVFNNKNLTQCEIDVVCSILQNNPAQAYIEDNGPHCESPEVVAEVCGLDCECPPGVNFYSQAKIDSFAHLYNNCDTINGNVIISGARESITNLDGLRHIEIIDGNLTIRALGNIVTLSGLENLQQVGGDFSIAGNASLSRIELSPSLTHTRSIRIEANPRLQVIDGFTRLTSIARDLSIKNNDQCMSIRGFRNLVSAGSLFILWNQQLTKIPGLANLDSLSGALNITGNPSLPDYKGLKSLKFVGGDLIADAKTFEGLGNIKSVLGSIRLNNMSPPNFRDLKSLENLGGLHINNCDQLTSFSGLEKIKYVTGDIYVSNADKLSTLSGLDNLISCNSVTLRGLDSLKSFKGLNALNYVSGSLTIRFLPNIIDFKGLNNLQAINGNFHTITNSSLSSFYGLQNLQAIKGDFKVIFNSSLLSFQSLEKLNQIQGVIECRINDNLKNFSGFDSLTVVNSHLIIDQNDGLETLQGLQNISRVDGTLSIRANTNLSSISSFSSLNSIGGSFHLQSNKMLESLQGLDNLSKVNGDIDISANTGLRECSLSSICRLLSNHDGIKIYGNGDGCNSNQQVLENCASCSCSSLQTNIWTNATLNGSWHNPYNWSLGVVPNLCHNVIISSTFVPIFIEENHTAQCYTLSIDKNIIFDQKIGSTLVIQCAK